MTDSILTDQQRPNRHKANNRQRPNPQPPSHRNGPTMSDTNQSTATEPTVTDPATDSKQRTQRHQRTTINPQRPTIRLGCESCRAGYKERNEWNPRGVMRAKRVKKAGKAIDDKNGGGARSFLQQTVDFAPAPDIFNLHTTLYPNRTLSHPTQNPYPVVALNSMYWSEPPGMFILPKVVISGF